MGRGGAGFLKTESSFTGGGLEEEARLGRVVEAARPGNDDVGMARGVEEVG